MMCSTKRRLEPLDDRPEDLEARKELVFRRRRTERQYADIAWVHPLGELIGGFAAASAFDAGNDQEHGPAPGLERSYCALSSGSRSFGSSRA